MSDNLFFVAHHFSKQNNDDLRKAIHRAFARSDFEAYYADSEAMQEHILTRIEERIATTHFGLYEVSSGNPNVYMELGYARGLGKRHYVLMKSGTTVPANIAGLQRIEYNSYEELTELLKNLIVKIEMENLQNYLRSKENYKQISISEDEIRKNCLVFYNAEELFHRFGYTEPDATANNGYAWCADLSQPYNHLVFGPYRKLPSVGDYVAFYKIKIDNNAIIDPLLELDVIGGALACKQLYGNSFLQNNRYQIFSLPFTYTDMGENEYRICNIKRIERIACKAWVDYIAITRKECVT
ncbi:MAG TPA: hypothetical protein PKN45_06940 [Candidatus Limiplasma sp.]|nr:hypothetical protein [Candidatus Limiplasma sp.]